VEGIFVGLEERLLVTMVGGTAIADTHMHVQGINTEVVGGQVDALEDLGQGEVATVSEQDNLIRALLHLALDKPQQVLLVHASRVMDVSVDFADVVKVSVRDSLTIRGFLVLVQENVHVELSLEVLQAPESKALARSVRADVEHLI
jgi:hypothetical protein